MTILCWNVQGLGNPRTFRALRFLLRDKKPRIIFLSKTKKLVRQMECVQRQLGMMGCFSVGREGRAGGLAFLWQHGVEVSILSSSPGHIDAILKGVDMETFRFTGFYGNPEMRLRRHSWDLLRRIAGTVQGPWLVGGDFNEILEAHEYFGRRFRPMSQMRAFREALEECGLTTIRFQGYKFTWSNLWQGDGNVKLRLDRMVANGDFVRTFPKVTTHHLNSMVSDHLPLLSYLRPSTWARKHKRFLFKEMWTTVEGCQDVITHAWEFETGTVVEKLKACQGSLRTWNNDHVGRIPTKLRSLQRKLDDTQRRRFSPLVEFQQRDICREMDVLLEREEMLWRQRSRVSWMKYGDKNTRFFHEHAKVRGRRNLITTIVDYQGIWRTSTESIGNVFCDYFQGLFAFNGLHEAGAVTRWSSRYSLHLKICASIKFS
ncbi:unnamed protein product [Prunus armeniaca]|uniref:Endonuclease/exonuclease/phosphatase domain-containing protein n=1 Tax=Prunus armeniaca TaxID=36596 RepID=A0A6J5XHS7_PRUAR|nr:unnamed protein product [Prunus armeniaca]